VKLWPHPARLPLGDGFDGVCRADREREYHPAAELLQQYCNLGYARRRCPRFPEEAGPDAVRFSVCGEAQGAIHLGYALEKDHRPHRCGSLVYDEARREFLTPPAEPILDRQAKAYSGSYLRRRGKAHPGRLLARAAP